ncbi:MAG TPA: TadE/TadG family type IV pilus assembly protein, partial [Phenylobacterium sp.]
HDLHMLKRLKTGPGARANPFRRAWRDRRGVSALEFALIAPVLILIYFGMAELSQGLMAERRVSHAASAMGDLIAQYDSANSPVKDADSAAVFAAAKAILSPFPTTALELRVTSIVMKAPASGGAPQAVVDWSDPSVPGGSLPKLAKDTPMTVDPNLLSAVGDSVILAEAKYKYISPVGYVLPNGLAFTETFYEKPRKTQTVRRCYPADNCP